MLDIRLRVVTRREDNQEAIRSSLFSKDRNGSVLELFVMPLFYIYVTGMVALR